MSKRVLHQVKDYVDEKLDMYKPEQKKNLCKETREPKKQEIDSLERQEMEKKIELNEVVDMNDGTSHGTSLTADDQLTTEKQESAKADKSTAQKDTVPSKLLQAKHFLERKLETMKPESKKKLNDSHVDSADKRVLENNLAARETVSNIGELAMNAKQEIEQLNRKQDSLFGGEEKTYEY